ncbi:hypothetical protein E2C01_018804 [Portunus trituberculatus]|uniref:Uncharacterized protein n=1 Tax=Portunus trituberculatus TaxID=210409 RepID=A0A5B7DVH5_PORTR|nr:hypothetical protein [Portunus trituberculatus]
MLPGLMHHFKAEAPSGHSPIHDVANEKHHLQDHKDDEDSSRHTADGWTCAAAPLSVLEGSLLEVEDRTKRDVPEPAEPEREARIAFTLWTTTTSTYTITSTSINSSTTFSLSFYCTVNGANDPPACG